LLPEKRLPFPVDDSLFDELSRPFSITRGKYYSPVWNACTGELRLPKEYSEFAVGVWLNEITSAMEGATGLVSPRIWSHRLSNSLPLPSDTVNNRIRKPDVVLITKGYYDRFQKAPTLHNLDWSFIHAFAEVTAQSKTSTRVIDTVNAKSYVMFICQQHRRFVMALSFTGNGTFTFTLTDHEGQLRLFELPLKKGGRLHAKLFLAFLMFGTDSDIGLDPPMAVNGTMATTTTTVAPQPPP
jgi:Fungal protein kinase